jgi:hypothetical protein
MSYTPDRWIILEINHNQEKIRKVFAGWYGGYLGSDSWQMNSGIVSETEFDDRWEFVGYSGSTYICYKKSYGLSAYMDAILAHILEKSPENAIRILVEYPEDKTQ